MGPMGEAQVEAYILGGLNESDLRSPQLSSPLDRENGDGE